MRPARVALVSSLCLGLACRDAAPGDDNGDGASETAVETGSGSDSAGETGEAPDTAAFEIVLGALEDQPLDCAGAWTPPDELLGADGLAFHGWTLDDLRLTNAWSLGNDFVNHWISDNDDARPSVRVRPQLAPTAAICYREAVEAAAGDAAAVLEAAGAFDRRALAFDELASIHYVPTTSAAELPGDTAMVKALHSLLELDNPLPGAPTGQGWSPALEAELLDATAGYGPEVQRAFAEMLIALAEAHLLTLEALAAHDASDWERIWAHFLVESYTSVQNTFVSPTAGTVIPDMRAMAADFDQDRVLAAGQRVTGAATQLAELLAAALAEDPQAFAGVGAIELSTPIGRILIGVDDDDHSAEELAATALVVDYAGDDSYSGQYASSAAGLWLNAGVLIDLAGDDLYGADRPDITEPGVSTTEAFDVLGGFSQGSGLFGVGVLVDLAGNDDYYASVHSQGAGMFGVGALIDQGGEDLRSLGHFGQGAGYFGLGLLLDQGEATDDYGIYSAGQGLGKPAGLGLLLDQGGDDRYVAYYEADEPYLPGPSYPNYYGLESSWSYGRDGTPHFMSLAQGVGWGYRGDWGLTNNWMGGFGTLVDLGEGADVYLADTFSKGMGFVYGFGFLSDGGGDDQYRSFWWGPAAGAHMGVGVLEDRGGNDDYFVTQASGGFGYDYSIAWLLDWAGDDRYGGRLHLGEGYTWGQGYFVDYGGDDVYNPDDARASLGASAEYGRVRTGLPGLKLIGVFLDLGGGADSYGTDVVEIGDDLVWHLAPVGDNADPALHKGVGIDR